MKRVFGNFVRRLLSGGTMLTEVEFQLLQQLVDSLPPSLRAVVELQFEEYDLVQREVDGRALNFYGRKTLQGPRLNMVVDEASLVRLTARVAGDAEPVHATLTAVHGRVFCMSLSRRVGAEGMVTVSEVKQAWRSNFHEEKV